MEKLVYPIKIKENFKNKQTFKIIKLSYSKESTIYIFSKTGLQ